MRIQLIGGPGVGKTLTAHRLFADLKMGQYKIEFVNEYVKKWAYNKMEIQKYDQIKFFAEQVQSEYLLLKSGMQHILTECPMILCGMYTEYYFSYKLAAHFYRMSEEFDEEFSVVTLLIERDESLPYQDFGRYQNESESDKLSTFIKEKTLEYYPDAGVFKSTQYEEILKYVKQNI